MKRFVVVAVFACASFGAALCASSEASAQGVARMCENLARPASGGACVRVAHHPDAGPHITIADRNGRRAKVPCYRVGLFLDNSQSAGAAASAAAAQFKELFPDVPVQVTYESPYFKVVAGSYIDHIDALILKGRCAAQFPKAVVVKDEISASAVIWRQKSNSFASNDENNAKDADN